MAYIFDTSKGETPEIVAQRRKMADALAARIFGRTPQNVGEGLSALGQAWIAGTMRDEADAAQKAGQASGNAAFSNLFGSAPQDHPAAAQEAPVGAPMGSNSIPVGKEEFVSTLMPLAQDASAKTGVDPRIIVAQAALESGWGKSAPGNNLFGIKSHGQPGGNVLPTTEVVDGQTVRTTDSFRAYNSPADSVSGYADFINKNPRYSELKSAPDLESQVAALGKSGYATDPNYAAKVGRIARGLPAPDGTKVAQAQTAVAPSSGPDLNTLIQASTNPWLSESQRAVVNTMLQQKLKEQQQASDPLRQLQIKKAQADLEYGKNPESVREYQFAKEQGFTGSFQDWIASKRAGAGEYSLTPVYGQDKDGNTVLIQPGKSGTAIQTKLPEGVTISSGVEKMDLGTQWGIIDKRTGQIVGYQPKDVRGKEREEAIGKGEGEAAVSLASVDSKMPGLEKVVEDLSKLSDKATYTLTGQGLNWGMRQLGFEPSEAAVARSQYISMVDNQVLPLLRDTFGAAFTQKEGDSLRNTLGDPDKSPAEKKAVLKSFIEQKRRDVIALQRRVGGQKPAPQMPAAPGGKTSSGVQWSVE